MKATKPTASFAVLMALAIILTTTAYYLDNRDTTQTVDSISTPEHHAEPTTNGSALISNANAADIEKVISTEDWLEYTDKDYFFAFRYPKDWKVNALQKTDFNVIVIEPKNGISHMRVYISKKEYIGMNGLKTVPVKIGGITGVSASGMVLGVKRGPNYFTFDAGEDPSFLPEFTALLDTVTFSK